MSARTAASLRCRYTVALVLTWMTAVIILPGCIARGNEALVDGGGELLGHDPLAFVLLGPPAAPDRQVPVFHVGPS